MSLCDFAEKELRAAGLFGKDSDYEGMIGESVMSLVRVFAAQGHSGFSAGLTTDIFNIVARYKTLSPITSNYDEWMEVGTNMWQNRRQSSCFSTDGGQTYYDIDAKDNRAVHISVSSSGEGTTNER